MIEQCQQQDRAADDERGDRTEPDPRITSPAPFKLRVYHLRRARIIYRLFT